jgi:flagellar biosynthesis protein FlhA
MSIDVGADLAHLLVPPLSDALLDRIGEVRRALAGEIGLVLPGVRLRDDLARDPPSYAIRVRDRVVAQGRLDLARAMAVADVEILARLGLHVDAEPVYGLPASWIDPNDRERVASAGALVFDPISIVGSHVAETVRRHASELLGRQELQTLIEHLRASMPALVREIGTESFSLGTLHKAFC